MPELPDVAVFQSYLESTSLHQTVEEVEVRDCGVVPDVSPHKLASVVEESAFTSTHRHGKHLFVELSKAREWLELHFGMTGELQYYKRQDREPEYARVYFHFDNAYTLAYVSKRKLGHVTLVRGPEQRVDQLDLGPDALNEGRAWEVFRASIAGRRGRIKSALMTQKKLAGIGNVYSDEILFHAHVDPNADIGDLREQDLRAVHRSMIKVLETAIDRRVKVRDLPRTWLLRHREQGERCPRCGTKIITTKASGRTSYVCPQCQKVGR